MGAAIKKPKYRLNSNGEFIIQNYNSSKPFANFFPGIAGKYGIPLWAFYVNRGQAIASFGVNDKDHSILEFFPANKAWQLVPQRGFRTFIKIIAGKKPIFYEPFADTLLNSEFNLSSQMQITSYDLKLKEDNPSLGIGLNVEYFTIPGDSYAGLARIVTLRNTSKTIKTLQIIDGLPQINPFGTNDFFLKKMSRTVEAWMDVENLDKGAPFYKLTVDPRDTPELIHIKKGNFYLTFYYDKAKPQIIKPIVDPESIFGAVTDFSYPKRFLGTRIFAAPKKETAHNKTPSALILLNITLKPGQEKTFYSLAGYMRNKELLNCSIAKIIAPEYLPAKRLENKKIAEALMQDISTKSSCRQFDLYAKQTYLDNIIRGGYPVSFTSDASHTIFYLYSRKHGDLERDYNNFHLQPTYFSQGNGNYRDVNQNRRNDVWFNPGIKDENVISLLSLIQPDGFNPLVVKGANFLLRDANTLKNLVTEEGLQKLTSFLRKPFTPGEVIIFIEENNIKLKDSYDEFLNVLLSNSDKFQDAEHAEGFWIDHWAYNLDLLEAYLGVYPEKLKEIAFDKRVFSFYDNAHTVKPRNEKYMLVGGKIRQLNSVAEDKAKRDMIRARPTLPHIARQEFGKGEIYQTTLMNKLLCLLANKLASLDPFGTGIEMEANKPNWFDALNGLPALFGSSACETFELKRLILFIKMALEKTGAQKVYVTQEICDFLIELDKIMPDEGFLFWDKSHSLRERYLGRVNFGFSGNEAEIQNPQLSSILDNALKKVELGIENALDKGKNIYCAYFINEACEYQTLSAPFVMPLKFKQIRVSLFLEAQMHALRISGNIDTSKTLYKAVKKSGLFDKKLQMYKVTESLESMPEEIGRCRIFSPGWLENESIWLHMEYKYLLECLRNGLYDEFYADLKNCLIPFQKPSVYGRSILENSSFLVSSAYADKKLHGNGFVARLSGSTAEFLQMWLMMNTGTNPFFLNAQNELNLSLKPILPGWLFSQNDKAYSFNLLSKILVTYHNPKRRNTFGKNKAVPRKIIFKDKDNNPVEILSDTIPHPYAQQIRSRQITRLDVHLR